MAVTVFMQVLDMTRAASFAIFFVLAARQLLKKAPKVFSYALWGVVLFRLLCPVSFKSPVSIMPELTSVAQSYTLAETPISPMAAGQAAYRAVGDALNGGLGIQHIQTAVTDDMGSTGTVSFLWWEVWVLFGQYLWLMGMAVMMAYAVASYVRLRRQLVTASLLRDNIYLADEMISPFVMGLFRPKIYLPSAMEESEQSYIILHEQYHIRRLDHIVKALAFAALCIHWFNPLVWLAFFLAVRDMEMSCDEAVIKKLGDGILPDYAASLLSLSVGKRMTAGTPPAFGEGDTKERIRNLAGLRKPAFFVLLVSALACVFLTVSLLTNPVKEQTDLLGANYDIKEVLYAEAVGEELAAKLPLQYSVTADYQLYVKQNEEEAWEYLGKLSPYALTKEELNTYLPEAEKKISEKIRPISDAYVLRGGEQGVYLVFQTRNGGTYLAYGRKDILPQKQADTAYLSSLYQLKSSFHTGYVNVGFFERSLRNVIDANVYVFANFESDRIPGYHIVGFKCGESSNHPEMTDMGFAVFETNGTGYRLLDCKSYEDAVFAENGVYFCEAPAVADVNGEMRNDNTFDVILVCNENVGKVERVYHIDGKEDITLFESNTGTHSMFLCSWEYRTACTGISEYVYDKQGNLLFENRYED